MKQTYPGLENLVGTAGIELGYTTAVSADGKDVVITDIKNLDDYGVTGLSLIHIYTDYGQQRLSCI